MKFKFEPYYIQRIQTATEFPTKEIPTLVDYYTAPRTDELYKKFKESFEILNCLIPLDYMGSSEFEYGAIPNTLRDITNNRKSFSQFKIVVSGIPEDLYCSRLFKFKKATKLYGWCLVEQKLQLKKFIEDECADISNIRLKESTGLQAGCFGKVRRNFNNRDAFEIESSDITGWLCLDNCWFVSTSKDQANGLAYMLGIDVKF